MALFFGKAPALDEAIRGFNSRVFFELCDTVSNFKQQPLKIT
jgi:hypothetical protein